MGYCMSMTECIFFIDAKDKAAALKLVKAAAPDFNDTWESKDAAISATTLEGFLEETRWLPVIGEDGNITDLEFEGEKMGDEEQFFNAMAPHVKSGSYIEMHGDEGEGWRWVFDGETCVCVYPEVTW